MVLLVSYDNGSFQVKQNGFYNICTFNWNRTDIKPAKNFIRVYKQLFGCDSEESMSKYKYGRRRNKTLRNMNKIELYQDYSTDHHLTMEMTKEEMIKQLLKTDVRIWVYNKEK